jgi:erythrocyte band 7 integral membrane protein
MATINSAPATESSTAKAPLTDSRNGTNVPHNKPFIHVEPPRREDLQPAYATVLKPDREDAGGHGWYGSMINTLGTVIGTCGAVPCCVICPNPYRPVQQGTVGLVTKFGRFSRAVDPGLVKVNPLSERLIAIDVKMQIVGT